MGGTRFELTSNVDDALTLTRDDAMILRAAVKAELFSDETAVAEQHGRRDVDGTGELYVVRVIQRGWRSLGYVAKPGDLEGA